MNFILLFNTIKVNVQNSSIVIYLLSLKVSHILSTEISFSTFLTYVSHYYKYYTPEILSEIYFDRYLT